MHKRMSRAIVALLALAIIASVLTPIVLAENTTELSQIDTVIEGADVYDPHDIDGQTGDTTELSQNDYVIEDVSVYDPHNIDELAENSETGEVILNEAGIEPLNLDSALTRGRAAAYIVMGREPALTANGNIPNMPFTDVPMSDWARNLIAWAWLRGWVNGRTATTFVPGGAITREEFTALIVRAFNIPPSGVTPPFSDWNSVSAWARPYVRSAHARGLILGFPDGTFRPQNNITRRDGITITQRASGRTITDPVPRTISWNANGGIGDWSFPRVPNHAIGPLPPQPSRPGHPFVGWFDTSNVGGGMQITVNTRVPAGTGTVTYWARWFHPVTMNYHIFVNSGYSTTGAEWNVNQVQPAFLRTFNINLVRRDTTISTAKNQRPNCPQPLANACTAACGVVTRCQAQHHRAGNHFIRVNQGNRTRSHFKFVNYRICFYSSGNHRGVNGLGFVLGDTMIATSQSDNIRRTTAHEISHLFGARDVDQTPCTGTQSCVMRPGNVEFDRWCTAHRSEIMANRNR